MTMIRPRHLRAPTLSIQSPLWSGSLQTLRRSSSDSSLPTRTFRRVRTQGPPSSSPTPPKLIIPPKARFEDRHFRISEEVRSAILENRPVVALETTIYTHGFPYPDNVALALDLEAIVRKNGGVPATIGILDGVARVGLSNHEIIALASSAGKPETMKVSRRDLPYILGLGIAGRKLNGGTTIAGTMFLARRAGINVFGTGGLGGVHRGGQDTMDISADLTELGRTPVAVISSGCKSFLDIPRTLEFLETQGAGVFTFADGRSGDIDFPAFFTRDSGVKSPMVVQNEREAAAMIFSQRFFSRSSGLLFANPIPEEFSIPKNEIDFAIDQAVKEAAEQGFHGHANTPFILARIKDLTKGNSIPANRALVESNVGVAARVAVELSKFKDADRFQDKDSKYSENGSKASSFTAQVPRQLPIQEVKHVPNTSSSKARNHVKIQTEEDKKPNATADVEILVYGSVAVDLSCDYSPRIEGTDAETVTEVSTSQTLLTPQFHTSNVSTITPSIGGVGHNVALAAQRAGGNISVRLCSAIADDLAGKTVLSALTEEGLDTVGIQVLPLHWEANGKDLLHRTAQYVAINDTRKDLIIAMADMSIFTGRFKTQPMPQSSALKWIVVDANWSPNRTRGIMATGKSRGVMVAFEPVSTAKSSQLFQPHVFTQSNGNQKEGPVPLVFPKNIVDLATPNQHELAAMHMSAKEHGFFESDRWWQIIDALGIPSSGARDRFVALTSNKMTDQGIPLQTIQLLPFIPTILTKLGPEGVLLTELLKPNDPRLTDPDATPYILSRTSNGSTEVGGVYMRLLPTVEKVDDVVSVNGVGDTFLGVLIAGLAKGWKLDEKLINIAQKGAVMTLRSKEAVSPKLASLGLELENLEAVSLLPPDYDF